MPDSLTILCVPVLVRVPTSAILFSSTASYTRFTMSVLAALSNQVLESSQSDFLALDLTHTFLDALSTQNSRRVYAHGAQAFFAWAGAHAEGAAFGRQLVLRYRLHLQERGLATATINLQLAAIRALAREAHDRGMLSVDAAHGVQSVPGLPVRGTKIGNWLSAPQARRLLSLPDRATLRGKRDYAILALLFCCGLRRAELASITCNQLQIRENRWVIADLKGKGGRVRTLPVQRALKDAIDEWLYHSKIQEGKIFLRILKNGRVQGQGLSPESVLLIVQQFSKIAQSQDKDFPLMKPHDARRTYAKLCRKAGGQLEEIQQNLGHSSLTTTERYLGHDEIIQNSINDRLELL